MNNIKIYFNRNSVCAGDDVDSHIKEYEVPETLSIREIISFVIRENYLPKISGGKATWSVFSNVPLAVIAQQWVAPRFFWPAAENKRNELYSENGVLKFYINYHGQLDPDLVVKVLEGIQVHA
ncbi:MAG: hypothetical protein HQL20_06790 [Candidatus Omnitrophica bacterium]|nr:hypothetical protein [Candidatus Omnitrophota bacterium]